MAFLYCHPNVLVVKNRYEILVNTLESGVLELKIGNRIFHENHTGIMPSESLVHKYRVPAAVLDKAQGYSLIFRAVKDRKSYFSEVGAPEQVDYAFRPITKQDDVNVIYTADIHDRYETIRELSGYFGKDLDLYIVNGDFGESENRELIRKVNQLVGDVTHGEIPAIIGRGNHDTRGKMAEYVTEYMATENTHAYFDFTVGPISGVVLDCGEDKADDHPEYNRLNFFEAYRREELAYLRRTHLPDTPFRMAICHVPFMHDSAMNGPYAIMPKTYAAWNRQMERLHPDFMICGHIHHTFVLPAGQNEGDLYPHSYPVIVGSAHGKINNAVSAITLKKSGTVVRFVIDGGIVSETLTIQDGRFLK